MGRAALTPTCSDRTLSEARGQKAAEWVEKEVYKLVGEIEKLGRKQSTGVVEITFGELFNRYADVSDTLVGILARAKKRDLLKYEGQGGHLLFQGKHDAVVITLDIAKTQKWRKEYESGSTAVKEDAAAVSHVKKDLTVREQYELEKKSKSKPSVEVLHQHNHHIVHHTKPAEPKPVVAAAPKPVAAKPVAMAPKPVAVAAKPVIAAAPKPVAVTAKPAVIAKPAATATTAPKPVVKPVTTAAAPKPVTKPAAVAVKPVASVAAAAKPNVLLKPSTVVVAGGVKKPTTPTWKPVNTATTARPSVTGAMPVAPAPATANKAQTSRIMNLLS
ncbi:hypothetical protein BASA81_000057 [Batrachochytrium salamandrivorans]|nr:hypothetical protein BASA81_000057 [Batrachochytrium salamandrivorans]